MNLNKLIALSFTILLFVPAVLLPVSSQENDMPSDQAPNPPSGEDESRAIVKNWDIVVSFEFGPTVFKLLDVMDGLKRGNNILFDATEGQFRFNKATIWTHGKNFNDPQTDIQIFDTGPNYRANAVRGGIDMVGATIRLGKTHYGMKWNSSSGAMTIAHEWAHYGLFQYDEYDDVDIGGGQIVSVGWCNYSLMASSDDIDLDTEFCTPDTHNYTNPNETWDKSGWEVIEQRYPTVNSPATRAAIQQDGPYIDDNDQMTFDVHYPDLYIEPVDIVMDPPDPLEGQGVSLTANFHNKDGLLNGEVVEVRFLDGPEADDKEIGVKSLALSGNEIETATVEWVAKGGVHDIYVRLDPNNHVTEWIEYDNNLANMTFIIPALPSIDPLLGDLAADEDNPMVLNLKQYESDLESTDPDLLWTVYAHDNTVISNIEGENSADDIITLTPKKDYFGTTDITLFLTDGDSMSDAKTINLTWNPINDAPSVGAITLEQDWVYRAAPVMVSFNGSDAEDGPETMSSVLEYKHINDTSWISLNPKYEAIQYNVILTTDATVDTGKYDLRAGLTDTTSVQGQYTYLNDSLWVRNNPAIISDYDHPSNDAFRGQVLGITIEGADIETEDQELVVDIEYMPKGEDSWFDGGSFDDKDANYNDGRWTAPFIPAVDSPRGICDVRIRLTDPDGPGEWLYINDTITIKNSLPVVESLTADKKTVYRTQEIILTITGSDQETANEALKLRLDFDIDNGGQWKSLNTDDYEVFYDGTSQEWQVTYAPSKDEELGTFNIRAYFQDEREEGIPVEISESFEVMNNPPEITITAKAYAKTGEILVFDAKGTTDIEDATAVKYKWDFGDGGKGTRSKVSHSFARAGQHTVKLTVTDRDGGEATEELKVTITGGGVGPGGSDMTLVIGAMVAVVVVVIVVVIFFMRQKGIGPFG